MIRKTDIYERLMQSDRFKAEVARLREEIEKHLSECSDFPTSITVEHYSILALDWVGNDYEKHGDFNVEWESINHGPRVQITFS